MTHGACLTLIILCGFLLWSIHADGGVFPNLQQRR